MLKDKNMLNLESNARKFMDEVNNETKCHDIVRNGTDVNKQNEVAKTTELRDDERAVVKRLGVQGFSIRFECCISPSNDSQRMQICRKTNSSDNPQCLAPTF